MDEKVVDDLMRRRKVSLAMGGEAQLLKLKNAKKLSVRERLNLLLDAGTFCEFGMFAHSQYPGLEKRTPADGVVAGSGLINGRRVFVIADDPTVVAGTRGQVGDFKLTRLRDLVLAEKLPLIMLNEAGAARVQETKGAVSAGLGGGFEQHFRLSGLVPQVSVHMGACFGGPSFIGSLGDFTVLVKDAGYMGMSGPTIVKVGIGLDHSADEVGGAEMAMQITGQVDYVAESEIDAIECVRNYLSYMPSSSYQRPPRVTGRPARCESLEGERELLGLVPDNHRHAYDAKKLIALVVDEGSTFEVKKDYGKSMITMLARMNGESVGFLANNPSVRAGAIDDHCAIKARRFIDLCDAFHIPLVFLCDTPGFMVGPEMEKRRMVSLCGRLMTSLIAAKVPKIQIVIRKAVGMAYVAMCGRACRPNAIVAWPTALFDVMGPEAGVMLAHEREISSSDEPLKRKQELLNEFAVSASAYVAAGLALIDDVISPNETRSLILNTINRASASIDTSFRHRVDP